MQGMLCRSGGLTLIVFTSFLDWLTKSLNALCSCQCVLTWAHAVALLIGLNALTTHRKLKLLGSCFGENFPTSAGTMQALIPRAALGIAAFKSYAQQHSQCLPCDGCFAGCCAGQPQEETQFSYVPPSAALQVYGCGVLITIGAALCFSSRQRCRLQSARGESIQSARGESMAGQFIQQSRLAVSSSAASHDTVPAGLIQPLLPESAV